MAYFANSSEGAVFDDECSDCRIGEDVCPIYSAQYLYNYDAVGNKVATEILEILVSRDGHCQMPKEYRVKP